MLDYLQIQSLSELTGLLILLILWPVEKAMRESGGVSCLCSGSHCQDRTDLNSSSHSLASDHSCCNTPVYLQEKNRRVQSLFIFRVHLTLLSNSLGVTGLKSGFFMQGEDSSGRYRELTGPSCLRTVPCSEAGLLSFKLLSPFLLLLIPRTLK